MKNLTKRFITLSTISLATSLLTVSTAITKPSVAIAQQSELSERSEAANKPVDTATKILENREEIKAYAAACKSSETLTALRTFRAFQTRLEYFTYLQFINSMGDLKLVVNDLQPLKLDHNCSMLKLSLEGAFIKYETLAIYWRLSITRNLTIIDAKTDIAMRMLAVYPELPVKVYDKQQYVELSNFFGYLVEAAKV